MAFAAIAPKGLPMFAIPRRYSHFVFGIIQSGLTSLIAAGIASFSLRGTGNFFGNLAGFLGHVIGMEQRNIEIGSRAINVAMLTERLLVAEGIGAPSGRAKSVLVRKP